MAVFEWLALRGKILTMDDLCQRGVVMVNACLMCLFDEMSVDRLLLNCRVAHCLSNYVLGWFELSWVLPKSIMEILGDAEHSGSIGLWIESDVQPI